MTLKATTSLDAHATAGFTGQANPHLPSSPAWFAHELGRHFRDSGRTMPRDVRMGRGHSIRVNDMLFKIGGGTEPTFERIN